MKKFLIIFTISCITVWASSAIADTWTQEAKLTASDGSIMDQFGASVSIDGNTLVIGARYDGNDQGSAYVFEKPVGGWGDMTETAKLTASDGAYNSQFGCAVSISGDTIVIGARGSDGYMGAAYVYERPVGGWVDMTETAKLTPSDFAASKVFGSSVSISGDTIVVGADGDTQKGYKAGAAYVFEKPVGGWIDVEETAKLTASDGEDYDDFGASVCISGDTVIVGANGDDVMLIMGQGSAYVFEKPVGGWSDMEETAKLIASDGSTSDYFGTFVSIEGDTVVIGAPGVDITNGTTIYDVGQAYVYEKPVGGWTDMTESAKLTPSDPDDNNGFGASLSISLDTVAIGAWAHNGYIGAVYVFSNSAGSWSDMTETAKLAASDGEAYDDFGYSVDINNETVVAGAHLDDDKGNSSGSAYVFINSGGQDPLPDIKANDSDGPLVLTHGELLSITIALDSGDYPGYPADWWCVADTPFGWYYYASATEEWLPGFIVSHQGPLGDVSPPLEVLNMSNLPEGTYTFYFGIDGWRNGRLDEEYLYYDSVEVSILP